MSLEQVRLFVLIFPPIQYAALVLWYNPSCRVIGFSLVTSLVMGSLNLQGDMPAASQGWWHVPFAIGNHAPLMLYLGAALLYCAGIIGLAGWWVRKRFGWRGGFLYFGLLGKIVRETPGKEWKS